MALDFDGADDYLDLDAVTDLVVDQIFSVTFWFYPRALNKGIMHFKDAANYYSTYLVTNTDGSINYIRWTAGAVQRTITTNAGDITIIIGIGLLGDGMGQICGFQ